MVSCFVSYRFSSSIEYQHRIHMSNFIVLVTHKIRLCVNALWLSVCQIIKLQTDKTIFNKLPGLNINW